MGKKKKTKQAPEGACPFCWQKHPQSDFVPPEISENPNLIVIGEAPGNEERKYRTKEFPNGRPFIGASGRILRDVLHKESSSDRAIIINASQCYSRGKPDTATINRNREVFLLPILDKYRQLPVVALGSYATQAILGGKRSETSLAGEVREVNGHTVSFTYHPAYYLYEHDDRIRDEIATTVSNALLPYAVPKYITGILPRDVEEIVIDVETTSTEYPWYGSKLTAIGIMPTGKPPYILKPEEITDEYKAYLAEKVRLVVGHSMGFDLIHLAYVGIVFPNAEFHDTLIYRKNLFPNEWSYGLKDLARRYTKIPAWQGWFHKQIADGVDLGGLEWEKLAQYNAYDLYATEQLRLTQTKNYSPFLLEMDYLRYIIQMILNGMYVNLSALNDLGRRTAGELINVESKIRETYNLGQDFNFRSPAQLMLWFEKMGANLPDTQEATLKEYEAEHPVVADVLKFKELTKFHGSIAGGQRSEGILGYVDESNLIHSTVAVHGAETSRSSSSRPNLQNTDPQVRRVFVSRFTNGRLIYGDLSALEYRLIAHIARESKLVRAFQAGKDIHTGAYQAVFGRESTNEVERKLGKTCNYAGVYGCGLDKFIKLTGLEYERAEEAFLRIKTLYPSVATWKDEVIYSLRYTGRVTNLFGRYREFVGRISQDIEREAVNWIIQSSGHDILKVYIMEVMDELSEHELPSLLVSEVHDSFTLDTPPEVVKETYDIVQNVSAHLNELIEDSFGVVMRVPITSKVKILEVWE